MDSIIAISPGLIEYLAAWELQKRLHARVAAGELPNLLLMLEHPHVYTLGRRGRDADILARPDERARLGVDVHHVDRGGEVTYHGPGQIVGYPIVSLREWGGGPLRYVRTLETVIVATLADHGIATETKGHPTGVWADGAKIAAIGVKVSRGVTTHGFALNVDPDLAYFDRIVPCGMPDAHVTSMSALGAAAGVPEVAGGLIGHFGRTFGWEVRRSTLEELGEPEPAERVGLGETDVARTDPAG